MIILQSEAKIVTDIYCINILLIKFDYNNNNSIISFEETGYRWSYKRIISGALKPGVIDALFIALVVVLTFIIFSVLYFKKKNQKIIQIRLLEI